MKELTLPYGHNQRGEFTRLKRKVSALQRQNIDPPQRILERLVELDSWLTKNYLGWKSNFPQKQSDT